MFVLVVVGSLRSKEALLMCVRYVPRVAVLLYRRHELWSCCGRVVQLSFRCCVHAVQ